MTIKGEEMVKCQIINTFIMGKTQDKKTVWLEFCSILLQ